MVGDLLQLGTRSLSEKFMKVRSDIFYKSQTLCSKKTVSDVDLDSRE